MAKIDGTGTRDRLIMDRQIGFRLVTVHARLVAEWLPEGSLAELVAVARRLRAPHTCEGLKLFWREVALLLPARWAYVLAAA